MEQKLYEGERAFVGRVRSHATLGRRPLRWSAVIFVAGFAVILLSFRSSLLLATFGVLVMVLAALTFDRSVRQSMLAEKTDSAPNKHRPIAGDLGGMGRRLRSRFFQQH